MLWFRKGIVGLLSLVLLVSLLGAALSSSANLSLTHPSKLETWLDQSKFYDAFITNTLDQAQKSNGTADLGSVSFNDPVVKQAAEAAFTPELLKKDVNTFLLSNYSWLEGKTNKPAFSIDVSQPKQNFANQVGQAAATRLKSLPACSVAQLGQLQSAQDIDPFTIPCRPPSLNPATEATTISTDLTNNDNFLSTPTITADTAGFSSASQGQPYYQKYSSAPKLYQVGVKLPWFYALAALLSIICIIFIAPRHRRGVRRVGSVFLVSGILLIISKFVADKVFAKVEHKIFNSSKVGQLQHSLTDFLHRLETQLVKVDLWFGIAFVLLALALFALLWFTRPSRAPKPLKPSRVPGSKDDTPPEKPSPGSGTTTTPLPPLKQPPRSRPPRLIQ